MMNIIEPIGLDKICTEVKEVCSSPDPYRIAGIKPKHIAVGIDKGNGRTTLLEYISDMFRDNGVITFSGGIDNYMEIELDGTLPQLNNAIRSVKDAAFYNNGTYCGVVGLDVTKISAHQNETQASVLEMFIEEIRESAVVVLFYPTKMAGSEEKFVVKIKSKLPQLIDFGVCSYTNENYADIASGFIEDCGIDIESYDLLCKAVSSLDISNASEVIRLAKELIVNADYSNVIPVIKADQLNEYIHTISIGG